MPLLDCVELATGTEPRGTVIWMHGLGADGWDFVPIVRELDPENALRAANGKFERRFRFIEQALRDAGRSPESCDLEELDALWDAAKKAEQPLSCG